MRHAGSILDVCIRRHKGMPRSRVCSMKKTACVQSSSCHQLLEHLLQLLGDLIMCSLGRHVLVDHRLQPREIEFVQFLIVCNKCFGFLAQIKELE